MHRRRGASADLRREPLTHAVGERLVLLLSRQGGCGNDERGIVFPAPIAPFTACVVPIGYHKSQAVRAAADKLYETLRQEGVDVLLDDRDERPGVLFADMDLIGVPHRVVLSERGLAAGNAEYKGRRDEKPVDVALAEIVPLLLKKLA